MIAPRLRCQERLLVGPGPSNVSDEVIAAMREPLYGHLTRDFHRVLEEVVSMLRSIYGTSNTVTFPLVGTGSTAMDVGLFNLVEPDDIVIVAVAGFFSERIAATASALGAKVITVETAWGAPVDIERVAECYRLAPDASIVAVVHADTGSGSEIDLPGLTAALRQVGDALLFVDAAQSLGGRPLFVDECGLDYVFAVPQKCLGVPPGLALLTLSDRAMNKVQGRSARPLRSLDFQYLSGFALGADKPLLQTTACLSIYGLHEGLRRALEEGLPQRWERHATVGAAFQAQLLMEGWMLFGDPSARMPHVAVIELEQGCEPAAMQRSLLDQHQIEVGVGLGPLRDRALRVALMGENATPEIASRVLAGLRDARAALAQGAVQL
jgi:alanine-glyoxylate transaminase/serine-glyoxylate transaminase/serine-pyruvate transaminase